MIKRIVMISLISIVLLSCEKQENDVLWGIWNNGKITNDKYAYTIPDYEKNYKVHDGYIVIEKVKKYKGVIYDLSENLDITEIDGNYPIYKLSVKLTDDYLVNNKHVDKNFYGTIIVHFIDKNTIWFENKLSAELNHLIKIRYYSIEFGPDKLFYRAGQVDNPIPKNKGELE